ncbi:MAG: cell division protein FtsK [Catenulispora sp. 13_1_20CM_3_70_7]|nr:MAG: cell division protein FtsK [Catenulispora sp. 13_1_20CM_3_70_7]
MRRVFVDTRQSPTYRFTVRHGAYVLGGTRILARRAWEARTTAMHHRMMRIAEAAGNEEMVTKWEQRAYAYRFARHKRRMDLLQLALNLPKAVFTTTVAGTGVLLMLGILIAWHNHNVSDVLAPMNAVIEFVAWVAFLASVIWEPFLYALPGLALAGAWAVGRNQHTAPTWALPADSGDLDVLPDENAIMRALENLSIAPLNKAIKEGWKPRWVQPTVRLGNGYHTQLQLPMGVTVEMINVKKNILAHNLLRKPVETWPTEPPKMPGVLDLWVADQGSLNGPVPPWPLLTEGTTDYFKGVPVAVSQRGEQIIGKLMAANWIVGGIMGSGKTSIVVALLLGAILDPLVEAEVYVMATNVDYDPLKPRLKTLVKGDDPEQLKAALDRLRSLTNEVTERGKLLEELGGDSPKLTRELALKDPRMRPRVVVFDECHELFMHKEYGKEAAELAIRVMKKARKVGITLIWVTVSPTADSIPRDVTRNTSHRVAFAVGDQVANDGLLGSRHRAGPRPGHRHRRDLRLHQQAIRGHPRLLRRPRPREGHRRGHPGRRARPEGLQERGRHVGGAHVRPVRPAHRHRDRARARDQDAHPGRPTRPAGPQPSRVRGVDVQEPAQHPRRRRTRRIQDRRPPTRRPRPHPRRPRSTRRGRH